MNGEGRKDEKRAGSRAVQLGFVATLLALWYLATTRWGVSSILLPNPSNAGTLTPADTFFAEKVDTLSEITLIMTFL